MIKERKLIHMELINLVLIEKIGRLLAYAVSEKKYNRYELIQKWLASDTYEEVINFSVHLCSQSKTYILAAFENEVKDDMPCIDDDSPLYEDDLYWFGYTAAYWFFTDGTTGEDLLKKINVNKMLDEYETLHTLSIKHAIDKIREDDLL